MAVWRNPIFDRTYDDVVAAKAQIAEWIAAIQKGKSFETYELKGCLNLSDINRIEGNIKFLSDNLSALGYHPDVTVKSWERSGIPNEKDIERIIYNIKEIIGKYYQMEGVSELPLSMMRWDEINAIEENLAKIKELYEAMVSSFPKSGTFSSGGRRVLPVSRVKDTGNIGEIEVVHDDLNNLYVLNVNATCSPEGDVVVANTVAIADSVGNLTIIGG